MSAHVCWVCDGDADTEDEVERCCSHVKERVADLQSRLDSALAAAEQVGDQWRAAEDRAKLDRSKKNFDDFRSISDEMINERAMLVREIVAWFDVMHSKYVVDGTPVELSEEWPSDWMRRAREILE